MLGVYDYTVVLTYVSLMVSVGGMMFAVNGHLHLGVMCLAISGLCDMFDGKIARTKKNRTEVEKRFGIQIDSLSDSASSIKWWKRRAISSASELHRLFFVTALECVE